MRPIPFTGLLLIAFLAGTKTAWSQSAAAENVREDRSIKVFALQNAAVDQIGDVVQRLIGQNTTVVSDPRTNSLIVTSSSEDELQMVEALLLRLDETDTTNTADLTQIVPLKAVPDAGLQDALDTVAGRIRYTIDPRRQVVVVRGTREDVKEVTDLLQVLESIDATVTRPIPEVESATLRVAWLMNGIDDSMTKPTPKNIQDAVSTLRKVGIEDLQLVTQLLVNVQPSGSQFETQGLLTLPDQVAVSVAGKMERDGVLELEVMSQEFRQMSQGRGQQPPPSNFNTSVRASVMLKPGQIAVLGASPCGSHDSVFVVELIP